MLSKHLDGFLMEEYINTPTDPFSRELTFLHRVKSGVFFKIGIIYNVQLFRDY